MTDEAPSRSALLGVDTVAELQLLLRVQGGRGHSRVLEVPHDLCERAPNDRVAWGLYGFLDALKVDVSGWTAGPPGDAALREIYDQGRSMGAEIYRRALGVTSDERL